MGKPSEPKSPAPSAPTSSSSAGARAVFAEWLARTGDVRIAAERAGVSERTGRRWKNENAHGTEPEPSRPKGALGAQLGEPTRFVGRKGALASLRKLLAEGARVVSVLGPAGIGKTRLSLRYADLNAGAYPGGVFFCDLSGAKTAEAVCAVVARVMGVTLAARATDAERAEQLGHAMDARGVMLLLLDNFEQAAYAAPATVAVWAAMARRAHVLVTSRAQLRVVGEASFWLDPLELPKGEAPADMTASEAVELFVDRARLSRPGYEPAGAELLAIAELVRRLDGNALAIELAASRIGMLSPPQLLARLKKRFELLSGGARDASKRQASMRVALDQSWDLLGEAPRRVLAQASLFRGGFSLEAAEATISDGGEVLETLEALRQSSLVYTHVARTGTMRFMMYETVRDYADERLRELGLLQPAARRFCAYFVTSARDVHESPSEAVLDLDNLIQAQAVAIDVLEDADLALRAALAAGTLLSGRAVVEEDLLSRALALPGGDAELRLQARVARGIAMRRRGNLAGADAEIESALGAAREGKHRAIEAHALYGLGSVRRMEGRMDEAMAELEESLQLAREVKDARLEAQVTGDIAHTQLLLRKATPDTMALAEAARALHHKLGNQRSEADMCGLLATLHQARGEAHQARSRYEEALALAENADLGVLAVTHTNLGTLYQELGNLDAALTHQKEGLRLAISVGGRRLEGGVRGNMANVLFEMGHLDEARESFQQAVRVLHEVGDVVHEIFFLCQLAAVIATQGGVDEAEKLFASAQLRFEASGGARELGEGWLLAMRLQRCHVDLARARQAEQGGMLEEGTRLREQVRECIVAMPKETTDDVRVAARMLARSLEAPSKGPPPKPTVGALTVSNDAASVWLPTTVHVSLEKRKPVRLLLLRLIDEHAQNPGHPLTVDDLLAAGWPGERVLRDAGASRVYVALGTLRKLGLRDVILSRDGGYLLDPDTKIVRASPL